MEPYVGEIRMFAGNYAPQGWALCNGSTLNIAGNEALYSLLGTRYGGDGIKTFNLPDLRGRVFVGQGAGLGLTPRALGQTGGAESVTLTASQIAAHNHTVSAASVTGSLKSPVNNLWGQSNGTKDYNNDPAGHNGTMAPTAIRQTGGSQAHNNMMPSMAFNFIIALIGIYPTSD